ncbi:LuxR C-terminal-related transcriptional regulator [Actinomadura rupiterrae]|uniref:LuxR C-terminal-related transcriptional regulator n=1 Tax=Actinomadura rupiterrae TaxID=559627 RepID=UPI0020A31A18|nr:LuxR family transcriptional regulator [Actinomadura rupiterrae]MCP2342380.1 DNA-binding NarL/FixJ family response regulator/Tfp pilus assembly protein PilF [Actinomadura rupiterrae]
MSLVGRADLVRDLAAAPGGSVVAIPGDPALGKTALLREVCRTRSPHSGLGQCRPAPDLAFGAFVRALEAVPGADVQHLPSDSMHDVLAAARAVRDPVLLALDDLHHADPDMLDLLEALITEPPPNVALLLAYRPRQAPPRLRDLLRSVARVRLRRLRPAEIAEMAGGRDGPALRRSGGYPGYVRELLRDGTGPSPLLAAELAHLEPGQVAALRATAVLGARFRVTDLAAVTGLNPERCASLLADLKARDLCRHDRRSGLWRHRHEVVREVLYRDIPPGERLRLHERLVRDPDGSEADLRLARGLVAEGRPEEARERLHRLLESLPPGDRRIDALRLCVRAEQLLGRHDEAVALAEAGLTEHPDSATLALARTEARLMRGDSVPLDDIPNPRPGRRDAAVTAFAALTSGNSPRSFDAHSADPHVLIATGLCELYAGKAARAQARFDQALASTVPAGRPYVLALRALALTRCGRLDHANDTAARAVATARAGGGDEALRLSLAVRASAAAWTADHKLASGCIAEALALRAPARSLANGTAVAEMAWARRLAEDHAGCADLLLAEGGGRDLPALPGPAGVLGLMLLADCASDIHDADRSARAANLRAEASGLPRDRAIADLALAAASRPADRAEHARRAAAGFLRLGDPALAAWALIAVADASASTGPLARAAILARRCGATPLERKARRGLPRLLDDHESRIATLVTAGRTNQEIAAELHLSIRTVERRLTALFAKLGVVSRAAVALAVTSGLSGASGASGADQQVDLT